MLPQALLKSFQLQKVRNEFMAMVPSQSDNTAEQETLSAYIDNQLSITERVALERRLQSDGRLQAELNELRAVKMALSGLPSVVPPRSFTLDPATVRGPVRLPLFQWMRLGSVVATMLLVLTFTLDFIATGSRSASTASAPVSALQATVAPAAGSSAAGGSAATNGAAPLSAPNEQQPTVAAAAAAETTERDQSSSSALQRETGSTAAAAAAAPAATSAPAVASEAGPAATSAPAAAAAPTALPEVVPPAPVHASDNSSPDTDSSALPVPKQQARAQNAPTNAPLRWLQLVLGIVAAALALGAWVVRRRERT